MSYDNQQGSYYVHAIYTVAPKEYKEIEIELKDIWEIPSEEIELVRLDARKVHAMLEDTEFSDRARFLIDGVEEKLDRILESQKKKPINPEDHISKYRENLRIYEQAKGEVEQARDMLSQTKPIALRATWKLILVITLFLGLLSLGFYVAWQRQVKLSEPPTIEDEKKE